MADTSFAALMASFDSNDQRPIFRLPQDWMQGRAGFGGLLGALALKSMRRHVPQVRRVRSLLIAFIGPVGPGDFAIHTNVLRSGKSVTHVEAQLVQRDQVCCVALGGFGGDRESVIQIEPAHRPPMADPDQAMALPYIDGLTPAFTRHFNYRWALGELPFSGKGDCQLGGWIQFREPTDCLTEEWLVALADAWPVPVLARLTTPVPVSTLTWEMGFVHLDRQTCTENDWWGFHSTADSAENGYVHERGAIWDPEGRLAAYSRQTSTIFA